MADDALGGADFVPHLTVAGSFEVEFDQFLSLSKMAVSARKSVGAPLTVTPIAYDVGETCFQSLYLRCDVSDAVRVVRRALHTAFFQQEPDFMPHISLYYGDADQRARRSVIADLPPPIGPFEAGGFAIAGEGETPMTWKIVERL
ncbi:MAG: hypothetical protein AAFS13_03880 [Pseudomonadota bacterium]